MNQIKKLTEELTKNYLIDKISRSLLEPEFKENNSIIPKALKYVVKKYCHHYKTYRYVQIILVQKSGQDE